MTDAVAVRLGNEGLLFDPTVLDPKPAPDGMQHDETRSVLFRLAEKSDRDPQPEAVLHPTVIERFDLPNGVLQYDVVAPYRPEALRGHEKLPGAYDNIPLPRQTCVQRLKALWQSSHHRPSIGLPDRRHQSHRQQSPVPVDGLSAEVWKPAGGEESRRANRRGVGCHP
jgi:hypothetical protein